MTTLCSSAENGCGTVSARNTVSSPSYRQSDRLSYTQMTDFMTPAPVSFSAGGSASQMTPASSPMEAADRETIPGQPDTAASGSTGRIPEAILPDAPQFQVPNNPLLPPGYQEVIDYENLQYLNGFLRTQIGKYVRVDQLMGSAMIEERYGYLVGVGLNYILLQELSTGNISAIDFYNIKYVYIYHTAAGFSSGGTR